MNAASPSSDGISQEKAMDHGEALKMMAAERYLLDELTPEERDAFELHMFDCQECALDLRAGSAFMNEAKSQLNEMEFDSPAPFTAAAPSPRSASKKKGWSFLWQPAFAMPVFAILLAVIAYQNFSAIPSLRRAASEPKVLYSNPIHIATRGDAHTTVQADRNDGLSLSLELPQSTTYSSYVFEMYDPNGKQFWKHTVSRGTGDQSLVSLIVPGSGLLPGSYTLAVSGMTPENNRIEIDRRTLDVQFGN
ncbi:MAG: zf-HC2 domain-containing protein [Acidobacteria bacterium]|nr:zf-HC2 domain-containing protein [Acidobacteriota bacterium]